MSSPSFVKDTQSLDTLAAFESSGLDRWKEALSSKVKNWGQLLARLETDKGYAVLANEVWRAENPTGESNEDEISSIEKALTTLVGSTIRVECDNHDPWATIWPFLLTLVVLVAAAVIGFIVFLIIREGGHRTIAAVSAYEEVVSVEPGRPSLPTHGLLSQDAVSGHWALTAMRAGHWIREGEVTSFVPEPQRNTVNVLTFPKDDRAVVAHWQPMYVEYEASKVAVCGCVLANSDLGLVVAIARSERIVGAISGVSIVPVTQRERLSCARPGGAARVLLSPGMNCIAPAAP